MKIHFTSSKNISALDTKKIMISKYNQAPLKKADVIVAIGGDGALHCAPLAVCRVQLARQQCVRLEQIQMHAEPRAVADGTDWHRHAQHQHRCWHWHRCWCWPSCRVRGLLGVAKVDLSGEGPRTILDTVEAQRLRTVTCVTRRVAVVIGGRCEDTLGRLRHRERWHRHGERREG